MILACASHATTVHRQLHLIICSSSSGAGSKSVGTGTNLPSLSFQPHSTGRSLSSKLFHCCICRCTWKLWYFAHVSCHLLTETLVTQGMEYFPRISSTLSLLHQQFFVENLTLEHLNLLMKVLIRFELRSFSNTMEVRSCIPSEDSMQEKDMSAYL